jgi:diguanylate cyclase (GGDEF)-like protein/PAS domain S-box-containing protein
MGPELADKILNERIRLLYANGKTANLLVIVTATILLLILRGAPVEPEIYVWFFTIVFFSSSRLFLIRVQREKQPTQSSRTWLQYYGWLTLCIGGCWAWLVFIGFGHTILLDMIIFVFMMAVSSLAVPVLVAFPVVMITYFLPAHIAVIWNLLQAQDVTYTLLSLALFLYVVVVIKSALRFYAIFIQSQRLRYENELHSAEQRKLNEQLTEEIQQRKNSEERLSLAMRGANDGLWDWNLETDEVYYSPRWKSMLGYEEDLEHHLDTWRRLVHPDDKEQVLEKVQHVLSGKTDSFEVEMRMQHKEGHEIVVLSRAFLVNRESDGKAVRLVGTHVDITERTKVEQYLEKNARILEMIATGIPAPEVYDQIALMYEGRHPGMRCSLLELHEGVLLHGGAPSMPKEYCDAVHGLEIGPNVGSCGTSTYTGERCVVENIETHPNWSAIKDVALPHGMRCCWSEPIKNSSGKVLGAFGMYYDYPSLPNEEESEDLKSAARLAGIVMERDQAQKRIRELAYTDELTSLASRVHFSENLAETIKVSKRHGSRFGLLYIDLDDFKGVNDSLGHDAGDLLLQEVARRLKKVSREIDFLARLSGDEFCILVKEVEDEYAAAHVAQRCLEVIAEPVELSGRKIKPNCSIGIAHYPDDGINLHTLLKASDTALYSAKEHGKNQYAFYRPELTHKAEHRFQMEQALREAIEKQQLSLLYQPQVDINSGEIVGVEALSRWNHPQLGQVPPKEFIATAESIGMIKPLTEWVLQTACNQAVAWIKAGLPALRMAVNISPRHFLDKDFISLIQRILNETGMNPYELELEVTENVVQTDQGNLSVFRDLKDIGVLIAIDDFGTGYSSFASLKHLTADYLKIDKHFIHDMLTDNDTQILVASMIEMGHNLKHGIIAEGVETAEQLHILQKIGSETAQGYLFSRPVSAGEIAKLMESNCEKGRVILPGPTVN